MRTCHSFSLYHSSHSLSIKFSFTNRHIYPTYPCNMGNKEDHHRPTLPSFNCGARLHNCKWHDWIAGWYPTSVYLNLNLNLLFLYYAQFQQLRLLQASELTCKNGKCSISSEQISLESVIIVIPSSCHVNLTTWFSSCQYHCHIQA